MKDLKNYTFTLPDSIDEEGVITPGEKKELSFGITFLEQLEDLTEKDIKTWLKDLVELSEVKKGIAICDLIFASASANDLEVGNKVDYTRYNVRLWVANSSEEEMGGVVTHMFSTLTDGDPKKKEEAGKLEGAK